MERPTIATNREPAATLRRVRPMVGLLSGRPRAPIGTTLPREGRRRAHRELRRPALHREGRSAVRRAGRPGSSADGGPTVAGQRRILTGFASAARVDADASRSGFRARGVRSALAVLGSIADLRRDDPAIAVRIAVNTGEAVVSFGTGPQVGEAVAGDVVNTASRMQAMAPPDGVVVGEATHRSCRSLFE